MILGFAAKSASKSLIQIAAFLLLTSSLTACFDGIFFFSQKGTSSLSHAEFVEPTKSEESGVVTSSMSSESNATQLVVASEGTLESSSVAFPPGSLAFDTNIVMEEGGNLASQSSASELGLQASSFEETGSVVVIESSVEMDTAAPMTIAIPLPGSTALYLDGDQWNNLIIIYHVKSVADGEMRLGLLTRASLTVKEDGTVSFETSHFGSYQAVITTIEVENEIEVLTTKEIMTKRKEVSLPEAVWAAIENDFDQVKRIANLSSSLSGIDSTNNCAVYLDRDKTIPFDKVDPSGDSPVYSHVIEGQEASTLFARFECTDNHSRTLLSDWTEIRIPVGDQTPPDPFAILNPSTLVFDGHPKIEWETSFDASSYNLVISAVKDCSTAEYSLGNLTGTSHVVSTAFTPGNWYVCMTSIDEAGNVQTAANQGFAFIVAASEPSTELLTAPSAIVNTTAAVFTVKCDLPTCSYEYNHNSSGWLSSTDSFSITGTEDANTIEIRAINPNNDVDSSPVSHNWFVDTVVPTAPTTGLQKITINDPSNAHVSQTNSTGINFVWSAGTDAGSGVSYYTLRYYRDGTCTTGATEVTPIVGLYHFLGAAVDSSTYSFNVELFDAAGNSATSGCSASTIIDRTAPSLVISSTSGDNINVTGFSVSFTFDEAVSGLVLGEIVVTNGFASNLVSVSDVLYTADITAAEVGPVTVFVGAGKASDAATNGSLPSNTLSTNYDATSPTVVITSAESDPTNLAVFFATATFSEAVTGFDLADVTTTNSTISNISGGPTTYAFDVSPGIDGSVNLTIAAGSVTDLAGNLSVASNNYSIIYDGTLPQGLTFQPKAGEVNPTNATSFIYSAVFSEDVTPVIAGDFVLTATGTAAGTISTVSVGNTIYEVTVSGVTGDGTLRLDLADSDNTILDAAGNPLSTNSVTGGSVFTVENTAMAPTALVLVSPVSSPGSNSTPIVQVQGVLNGSTVGVYSDISCSTLQGSATSAGTTINITLVSLVEGSHNFYAKQTTSVGNVSGCSSSAVAYFVDTFAPAAASTLITPADLATDADASIDDDSEIFFKWTLGADAGSGITSQTIAVYSGSGCLIVTPVTTTLGPADTNFTKNGAVDGTTYSFNITSTDGAGNQTTSACSTDILVQTTPPDPTSFSVALDNPNQATVSWISGGPPTTGFIVAYEEAGTPAANCTTGVVTASANSPLIIRNLKPATNYEFRVCAVNSIAATTSPGVLQAKKTGCANAHSYWRLSHDGGQESVNWTISDLRMFENIGSGLNIVGDFASRFDDASGGVPANAFDNDPGTNWTSGIVGSGLAWVGLSFGSPRCINEVEVFTNDPGSSGLVHVEFSDNGTVWTKSWSFHLGQEGVYLGSNVYSGKMDPEAAAFVDVSVGSGHACGTQINGDTFCWGNNGFGQLGDGTSGSFRQSPAKVDLSAFVVNGQQLKQLSAGNDFTCGINLSNDVGCWGSDGFGQLGNAAALDSAFPDPIVGTDLNNITGSKKFKAVSAGSTHACALAMDGKVACWGNQIDGRLGNSTSSGNSELAIYVDLSSLNPQARFTKISSGSNHTCGLLSTGEAACWGVNISGQLGDGTTTNRFLPTLVSGSERFVEISVGLDFSCALTSTGNVLCWGDNGFGQLGAVSLGVLAPISVDMIALTGGGGAKFVSIEAGDSHACGISNSGHTYCWGNQLVGRLGNGLVAAASVDSPVIVTDPSVGSRYASLSAGGDSTCAFTGTGKMSCWGGDSFGQLGNGGTDETSGTPSPINEEPLPTGAGITMHDGGSRHSCRLNANGEVNCSGFNTDGELGINSANSSLVGKLISKNSFGGVGEISSLSVGKYHNCAITSSGETYCWGLGTEGQIGDGGNVNRFAPTVLLNTNLADTDDSFKSVSASEGYHACGISAFGKTYCWGRGTEGQIGDGANAAKVLPTQVNTLNLDSIGGEQFASLVGGFRHSCGLTNFGNIYCWGGDSNGQLGNAAAGPSSIPAQIDLASITGAKFVSIHAGPYNTCAIRDNGIGYCWGDNLYGQLGIGASSPNACVNACAVSPTAVDIAGVGGDSALIEFALSAQSTCGLFASGQVECWGSDSVGKLGLTIGDDSRDAPAGNITFPSTTYAASLSSGWEHVCAVGGRGDLNCWGGNADGQIGIDSTASQDSPTNVNMPMPGPGSFCPDGFIGVPGIGFLGTSVDFCVAKYEMSDNAGTPVSVPFAVPQVSINRTDASSACVGIGAHLMTNSERMTIARSIEVNKVNWDSGAYGSGILSSGHSDANPPNVISASSDDFLGCFGTGQSCDMDTFSLQRRTHRLMNGEVIWDFAGNASEWLGSDLPAGDCITGSAEINVNECPSLTFDQFRPSDPSWDSSFGIGTIYGIDTQTTAIYGGSQGSSSANAGIYNLQYNTGVTNQNASLGYRCVKD